MPFGEFVDIKIKNGEEKPYKYTLGKLNAAGIPEKGIVTEWMDYVQVMQQKKYPDRKIAGRYSSVNDFNRAYKLSDEPNLEKDIERGDICRLVDIFQYYGDKTVAGEGKSCRDYILENVNLEGGVLPDVIANEVKRIVLGLCAQESWFNNDVSSRKNAKGIFQFMPDTAQSFANDLDQFYSSIPQQVAAFNQFIPTLFKEVKYHIEEDAFSGLKDRFEGEDSFYLDLLTPLIISSYNAGSARVGEAARLYYMDEQARLARGEIVDDQLPRGKELFLAIVDFAKASKDASLVKYGDESREYVLQVYAKAEALTEVKQGHQMG